jgi:hypothetical protein
MFCNKQLIFFLILVTAAVAYGLQAIDMGEHYSGFIQFSLNIKLSSMH